MSAARAATIILASLTFASPAGAQDAPPLVGQNGRDGYAFLAAPTLELNRMFRVDRATGEMGVCQYAVRDRSVGVTLCLPPGEGAGPQEPGSYDLVASNHIKEAGVFRVDRATGRMSICYVLGEQVLCTPWSR